jgi:hypothetical protein
MKVVLSLLAVLFATALSAQDAQEPQDPKALVKAREAYQKEIARVTAPVNQNYLQTLEALKRDFGTKGDTAGMVAVQKEIDEVKTYLKNEPGTVDPMVGKWLWDGRVMTFTADGKITNESGGSAKWKRDPKKSGGYLMNWGSWVENAVISKDGKTITAGGKFVYKKIIE